MRQPRFAAVPSGRGRPARKAHSTGAKIVQRVDAQLSTNSVLDEGETGGDWHGRYRRIPDTGCGRSDFSM
jgi:hypothetical protein